MSHLDLSADCAGAAGRHHDRGVGEPQQGAAGVGRLELELAVFLARVGHLHLDPAAEHRRAGVGDDRYSDPFPGVDGEHRFGDSHHRRFALPGGCLDGYHERIPGTERAALGHQGEGDRGALARIQRADHHRLRYPSGVQAQDRDGEQRRLDAAVAHSDVDGDAGTGTAGDRRWELDLRRTGILRGRRSGHGHPPPAVAGALVVAPTAPTDSVRPFCCSLGCSVTIVEPSAPAADDRTSIT